VPIPFRYKLPTEHVAEKDILDLNQFVVEAASLSDAQKARKLHNKSLETGGDIDHSNRKIRYKAIFVPKRDVWETISERAGLDPEGFYHYRGGLWFVTKGMPTGVEISPPVAGAAGYWPNFYLLIEDSGVIFDLGRKAIPGRTLGFLRDYAKGVFNKFTKFQHYFKGEPETRSGPAQVHERTIAKRFEELMGATDLELGDISYLKHPNGQEAAVVAIFHELVGANVLKGYYGLQSSYRSSYDFWCKYRITAEEVGSDHKDKCVNGVLDLDTVIEFKHNGEGIIRDLDERRKYFEDITLLVCWDFDQKAFSDRQITVRTMRDHERVFNGSNFVLEFPGTYNLGAAGQKHVLALRQFIQDRVSSRRKPNE
jgi:molecular chaperone HtpG